MRTRIVTISGKTLNVKSKYDEIWSTIFTEEELQQIKEGIEQIKQNPVLAIEIDISEIKNVSSDRKNAIHERAYIYEDGSLKAYGSAAKSLAKFLAAQGFRGITVVIKEVGDNVVAYIKCLNTKKCEHSSSASE
jgi:hypothetical protein